MVQVGIFTIVAVGFADEIENLLADTIAAHAPQPICWPGISAALIRGAKVAKGLPVAGGENGLSGGVSPLPNTPPQRHAPEHGDNLRATMTIL